MTALASPFSRMWAVSARVSMPAMPMMPRLFQPGVEMTGRAIVGRLGDVGLDHRATHAGCAGHVDGLYIFLIGADIADMGEGEGDDLSGIGGIREDLLIAGDCGVEADLGDSAAGGTNTMSLDDGAIRQNQKGGRFEVFPRGGENCGFSHANRVLKMCVSVFRVCTSSPGKKSMRSEGPCDYGKHLFSDKMI